MNTLIEEMKKVFREVEIIYPEGGRPMAERTEQKTVVYRKCDFCEQESERQAFPGVHFNVTYEGTGAITMDICSLCQGTVNFAELYEKSVEVWKAMQPAPQPHNADIEEWRR